MLIYEVKYMSASGVFQLVVRDERFDKFFVATDALRRRLKAIKKTGCGLPTVAEVAKTHLMYTHKSFKPYVAIASEYTKIAASGGVAAISQSNGSAEFTISSFGHFTSDMVCHVRIKPIGTQSPSIMPIDGDPAAFSYRYRYCAYPGIRLFKRVAFQSDSMLIDDYVREDVTEYSKFFVGADAREAFNSCMGQQNVKQATYASNNYTGVQLYADGAQTLKFYHNSLDLLVPLQFYICRDASNALPNDMLPATQRKIVIDLAQIIEIIQAVDQAGNIVPLPFAEVKIELVLYVNHLYVNPEIHDIVASRVNFMLMRVHKRQITQLQTPKDSILQDQLKFPAEYLFTGIRSKANAANFDQWWLMGKAAVRTPSDKLTVPAMIWNSTLGICQLVCREATETTALTPLATSFGIEVASIPIYQDTLAGFYSAYLPLRYRCATSVVAPTDPGSCLILMCLYPGNYDPSGYFNLSAGREFYVKYTAPTISSENVCELVTSMSALNFLIRKGDVAALLYAI